MDKPVVRISVRNLVEFILRSGDLDNRRGSADKEAMLKGSRLHRKIQSQMGSHYRAEVSLKYTTEYDDVSIAVEGRADGIFTLTRSKVSMQMSASLRNQWKYIVPRPCAMPVSMPENSN